jgi:hypothetical protein
MANIKRGTKFHAHCRVYRVSSRCENGLYNAEIIEGDPNPQTGKMFAIGINERTIKKGIIGG